MEFDKVLVKNISSLFSIKIAGYLIPLITLPYMVQTLEPIGYGELMFAMAIIQYFILFVNYGFDLSATQQIAKSSGDKNEISLIFWNVLTVRVLMSLFGLVPLFLMCEFVVFTDGLSLILIYGYLSVFGAALFPQWLFQGKEQLGTISVMRVILQMISVPLIFLFISTPEDAWVAAILTSLPSLMISFYSFYLIKKRGWVIFTRPTLHYMYKELNNGWHLFISTAAISLYTTSVTIVLGIIAGPISVAIYASANKLLQAAQGLYTPISSAFYPRINSLMSRDQDDGFMMIRKLMKIQFFITSIISICLFLFAPLAIDLLFGKGFEESVTVLRIIAILPIVIGLSNIFGIQTLLICGYKNEFSKILLLSGVLNMTMLIPLCYMYSFVGAALSVVVTEVVVTTLMLHVILNKKIPLFRKSYEV